MQTTEYDYGEVRMSEHRLPRWWLAVFWASAVFAFFYWGYFHVFRLGD